MNTPSVPDRAGRLRPLQMILGVVLFVLAQVLAVAGGSLIAVLAGDDLSAGTPGWAQLGLVIEAGILLGAAYLVTRRLWFVIGIHLAWNAVQGGVYSSSISGTEAQHGLLRLEATGPDWLTGGTMGVEGSAVTVLVGLVAGIILLVIAVRRGHLVRTAAREASA